MIELFGYFCGNKVGSDCLGFVNLFRLFLKGEQVLGQMQMMIIYSFLRLTGKGDMQLLNFQRF